MTAKHVATQAGSVTIEGDELVDSGFKMKVGGTQHLVGLAGNIIKILVTVEGRIDPEDPADCERWARYFDVTTDRLTQAMRAVGTHSDEVRRFLGKPLLMLCE